MGETDNYRNQTTNSTAYEEIITLRLARIEEVPALSRLMVLAIRELQKGDYTTREIESALKYVYGMDTLLIHDGTYFVAQQDGNAVGCGGWSRRRLLYGGDNHAKAADDHDFLDPTTEPARIRAFFVHPDWARRGIGRMLLSASERAAYTAGFRSLELMATRTGVALYRSAGYTILELVSKILPDGVPISGYRMAKTLTEPPR
jgi:GNAT superfamily N-acetyltransferase